MQVKYSKLWRVIGIFPHTIPHTIGVFPHLHLPCSEMAKFLLEAAGSCEAAVNEGDFESEERLLVNLV